jgi:histidinol-phosphatase
MSYEHETHTMLSAARQAGKAALHHFMAGTTTEEKEDQSPVTAADRECEQVICGVLSKEFPEDGILGEEGTARPSRSGRRWLVDPIDGTRDFVRHNSFWSNQIALENQGKVVLGAIYIPCLDQMLHAVSGAGCYWNGARTMCACTRSLDKAILMVSGLKSAWSVWPLDSVRRLTEICWTVRGYGAGYDMVMFAQGRADIWLSGNGMEWDYAPARIIAQELGARFLTKDGTGRIDARHCLICMPSLEQELRSILQMPA